MVIAWTLDMGPLREFAMGFVEGFIIIEVSRRAVLVGNQG